MTWFSLLLSCFSPSCCWMACHGLLQSSTTPHNDEAHLQPIMQHIAKNVEVVNEWKTELQVVKRKYSGSKLMNISLLPERQSPAVNNLAAPRLLDNVPVEY